MNAMKKCRLKGAIPSQQDVAKVLGVSMSCVSKWENGTNKPRANMLPLIAKLYGCSIEALLEDDKKRGG